uniref:Uncharacterized protein n=1 Tax=Candidatus Kentrum sp. SD TaxID=2126332 RepID=A0A450YDT6_9GAMM|nr:MAG: hypothetical protein BECKSD772F_GA0070984_10469 [Candidatus Kentron sp. SD]VFK44462.1 MAG: hypothetical protein BECKSD772E_GA0070983_10389 [Candidatus Kentron sp. SD]
MTIKENPFLEPIEKAIKNHTSNTFIINQNHEIVIPENGKSLLHPNYYDIGTMQTLFEKLCEEKKEFISNDVEVDSEIFIHRLNALATFLKRIGEDSRAVARIITTVRPIEGSLKIEAFTLRLFDNMSQQILSKALLRPEVKDLFNGFCQQREMKKWELLAFIDKSFS